jgi:hypothetical protein
LFTLFAKVLIELVKSTFIEMETDNILVPWIYLCFNKDLSDSKDPKADVKKGINMNISKTSPLQGGTSTNINKS